MTLSNGAAFRSGCRRRAWPVVKMSAVMLAAVFGQPQPAGAKADELPIRESRDVAYDFIPRVEALLDSLPLDRERFEVRVNACEGRRGETRRDIYYIWIGLRGVAPGGDAGRILESLHARLQERGWQITRYRHLPEGGVNLAAREPGTGDTYMLDSGFRAGPDRYVVGFFNTPCYRSPSTVRFGSAAEGWARD